LFGLNGGNQRGRLCIAYFADAGLFVVVWHSLAELNGKSIQGSSPIADGQSPFLGNVLDRQIEQLVERFGRGEEVAPAVDVSSVSASYRSLYFRDILHHFLRPILYLTALQSTTS
jgi:hypothetical protein